VRFVLAPGVSEARIELTPDALGPVTVRIVLRDGALSARLEAPTPAGRLALEEHRAELEVALAVDGVAARVEVVAPPERPPEARAPHAQPGAHDLTSADRGDSRGPGRHDQQHQPAPPADLDLSRSPAAAAQRSRRRPAPAHAPLDTLA